MALSVLYIEDDKDTREMLAELLGEEGFIVRAAATLREAEEALDAGAFDLVMSDYELPDGDGTSFIESVRGRLSGARVVMITGHAEARSPAGVPRWLKPIDPRTVSAKIRALLEEEPDSRRSPRLAQA